MSLKTIVPPLLAASFVAAVSAVAVSRRREQRPALPARRAPVPLRPPSDTGGDLAPRSFRDEGFGPLPLPHSFWEPDPDRVDALAQAPAPFSETEPTSTLLEAIDIDELGSHWLARATQGAEDDERDAVDDPEEIPADSSFSTVGEASRVAASPDFMELDALDDPRDA